jgi:hypothetical protein
MMVDVRKVLSLKFLVAIRHFGFFFDNKYLVQC